MQLRQISTSPVAGPLCLILGVSLAIFLPLLTGDPPILHTWDEAVYANGARHMVEHGYWLIPHLHYRNAVFEPFLLKPPLVMWIQGISMSVLGVNTFSARLPSVIAGIGTAFFVFDLGRRQFNQLTGTIAALLFLVLPPVWRHSHSMWTADLDMIFLFFGTVFIWSVWRAIQDSPRWLYVGGAAAGLAVLSKGVAAGIFVLILLPVLLWNWRTILSRDGLLGGLVAAAVALSWHLYAFARYGAQFIEIYIIQEVLGRATGGLQEYGTPIVPFMNYPYFQQLPSYFWYFKIPVLLSLFTIPILVYRDGVRNSKRLLFHLYWLIVVPLSFGFLGGNHMWYVLPMVIPAAILMGYAMSRVTQAVAARQAAIPYRALNVIAIFLVLASILAIVVMYPAPANHRGGWDSDQHRFAAGADIPNDMVVYYDSSLPGNRQPLVFAFYENQNLEPATPQTLDSNRQIRYALVSAESLSSMQRPYDVLSKGDSTEVVLVRFTDESAK